jgi:hypothetical protein
MANLLQILARKQREAFFAQLDAQWGRGPRSVVSRPDSSPNPSTVTGPRHDLSRYEVKWFNATGTWETIWSTEWRELAEAYAKTLRDDGLKSRVTCKSSMLLSRNQSARIADLVAKWHAGCQNQTLVK